MKKQSKKSKILVTILSTTHAHSHQRVEKVYNCLVCIVFIGHGGVVVRLSSFIKRQV